MAALSEVLICNMALQRCGVSIQLPTGDGTIAGSTDTSLAQAVCELWYERCRNRALEGFPWTFARAYQTLVLNDDGEDEIWQHEFANAYDYPTDCLRIRRFVTDVGHWDFGITGANSLAFWADWRGSYEWRYVIRLHGASKVIMTNVEEDDADIEFTKLVTDTTLFTEQFASALAWMLAAEVAVPLSVDLRRREQAVQMFVAEMRAAAANMLNEETEEDQPDGSFIRSRG